MPWPVRSKRFGQYSATPAANTPVDIGTVPTGKKWLVKDWSVFNQGASTRAVYIIIKVGGTSYVVDAVLNLATGNPAGNPNRHFVLNAGEVLQFQTTTAQKIDVQISGAELG